MLLANKQDNQLLTVNDTSLCISEADIGYVGGANGRVLYAVPTGEGRYVGPVMFCILTTERVSVRWKEENELVNSNLVLGWPHPHEQ